MSRYASLAMALGLALATVGGAQVVDSQAHEPVPQRYVGRIASLAGPTAGGTAFFTLQIDRFATDAEVQVLAETLAKGGEDALLEAVRKTEPGGWFKVGTGLRYLLRVVRMMETPEGRVLIALTDRPIQIREVRSNQRSLQYAFGWIQITFDEDGVGEGGLIPSAKVSFDEDQRLVVEAYELQPLRLLRMKSEKVD